MKFKGIDVSVWQGDIDWQKVKNAGIDFAMIREGYGTKSPKQIDSKFKDNVRGAKSVGINIGVYHYSYASSTDNAKLEAQFCLENIQGYSLEYPVVYDIEDKTILKLTNRQRADICKAFCEEIERNGYYAMIYTNKSWLDNYLYAEELLKDFDLWLAQWNADKLSYSCGIWQYSDSGKIDGISGNVDLNISYKNYPEIMKNKGLNGFKTNTDVTKNYFEYKVQKGDTLWDLAKKYLGNGTRYNEIKMLNNLTSDTIYAGQILKIFNN